MVKTKMHKCTTTNSIQMSVLPTSRRAAICASNLNRLSLIRRSFQPFFRLLFCIHQNQTCLCLRTVHRSSPLLHRPSLSRSRSMQFSGMRTTGFKIVRIVAARMQVDDSLCRRFGVHIQMHCGYTFGDTLH